MAGSAAETSRAPVHAAGRRLGPAGTGDPARELRSGHRHERDRTGRGDRHRGEPRTGAQQDEPATFRGHAERGRGVVAHLQEGRPPGVHQDERHERDQAEAGDADVGPVVATDDRSGDVVVVNRTAATATVVDPCRGVIEETVATGANPHHVEVADGVAYVVDKSGAGANGEDQVTVIRLGH